MTNLTFKLSITVFSLLISFGATAQDFQGKAYYFSKSTMNLGTWGAKMPEAQKKQIQERLKNRLEKTYILTFNKQESSFKEEDKLDAISGATDSWGKNFTPGYSYKNIKTNSLIQNQEFYGKRFLVKDSLPAIAWKLEAESKQIGKYICQKATAIVPTAALQWYNFSWSELRNANASKDASTKGIPMTQIEAWYTPQIPVSLGPLEYWGLPGLILEVSAGNTTMLCYKIIMNPEDKTSIEAPDKGKVVAKLEYKEIITNKMKEMRNNRGRPSGRRSGSR
jgi:GLPGLI family protein